MNERARAILATMENLDVLENLPRSGYLLAGVRQAESVAAHVAATALLAMLLADAEGDVDVEMVLRMALLHETGEAILTDLPRPAGALFPDGVFDRAELNAAASVLQNLPQAQAHLDLIAQYQRGESREAKLVRAADKLQMLCKVRFYESRGQGNLEEFFTRDQGMDLEPFPVAQALLSLLRNPNSD